MDHKALTTYCALICLLGIVTGTLTIKPGNKEPQRFKVFSKDSENDVASADIVEVPWKAYAPTWESLDSRPLPAWYDTAKVGIFIHWGVFSVPGLVNEWFWWDWQGDNVTARNPTVVDYMKRNYAPEFTYQEFGPQFTAEFFNATEWAELFKKAGARYVVLTSKHHEGFTNWPSKYGFGWNSMDIGPKRDLVGELAGALRNTTDLRFGIYHSLTEWFNPLLIADKASNWTTNSFVKFKTMPELYELVTNYHPDVVWSDGEWGGSSDYWDSRTFLAWLYNSSPVKDTVVTNDRWGTETSCKHGGFFSCYDRYNPGVLQPHKWENCMTLDKQSWGFRRNARIEEYLTPHELIQTVVETVACGGNILINVGPTKDGVIVPIQQERLLQLGEWLKLNGEAIYETSPWKFQNDSQTPGVWYTSRPNENKIYAITLEWPRYGELALHSVDPNNLGLHVDEVKLLGSEESLTWNAAFPGIKVTFPEVLDNTSKWAWTLVISTKPQKKNVV